MKSNIRTLAICGGALALCATAQASLVGGNVTTSTAGGSWASIAGDTLVYSSMAAPNTGTTAQGNVAAAVGSTAQILSETFTPSSSYNLGGITVVLSTTGGTATPTLSIGLYDVTGVALQTATSYTVGTDLLGGGSGFTFALAGQNSAQDTLTFDNVGTADQVALVSGHTYAFEISTPTAQNSQLQWYRGGAVATDGQMMGTADSTTARTTISQLGLAGGAPRTAELAVYAAPVPEPTTLALAGLGGLASLVALRRKK